MSNFSISLITVDILFVELPMVLHSLLSSLEINLGCFEVTLVHIILTVHCS